MRPLLLCRAGDDEGLARIVGEQPLLLGRARDCDIPLADPQASRRHARVALIGGHVRIEDLGSAAGTSINGARLQAHLPQELSHADTLLLADTTFLFLDLDAMRRREVVGACIIGPGDFRVPLREGHNLIGAAQDCDLVVDDPEVAPRHADLVLTEEGCRIVREATAPPVFVNGEPVEAEADLTSGDVFQLSPHAYFGVEIHCGTGQDGDARAPWRIPAAAPSHDDTLAAPAAGEADVPTDEIEARPLLEDASIPEIRAAPQAEDDGDRTHATPPEEVETTSTLRIDEIRHALDRARARHASEVPHLRPEDSQARTRDTPLPAPAPAPAPQRTPRPAMPPDFRAARREAAVRIHVLVPGGDPLVVLLREGTHALGRSERCRVRLSDASIAADHAEIHVGPQGIRVRALSADGLVLRDGRRLVDAIVAPGEKLAFGELQAWFEPL